MHLLHDEHGNLIAHGEHHHSGETALEKHEEKEKRTALLTYMLQHNQHHAAELEEMVFTMQKENYKEAADEIQKSVNEFRKGNEHLEIALKKMMQE